MTGATELLNKVLAIINALDLSYPAVGKELGIPHKQLWDMLNLNPRRANPNGPRHMALHKWVAKKTLQIAKCENKIQQRFRVEYRRANARFPVNGSRE